MEGFYPVHPLQLDRVEYSASSSAPASKSGRIDRRGWKKSRPQYNCGHKGSSFYSLPTFSFSPPIYQFIKSWPKLITSRLRYKGSYGASWDMLSSPFPGWHRNAECQDTSAHIMCTIWGEREILERSYEAPFQDLKSVYLDYGDNDCPETNASSIANISKLWVFLRV